MTEQLTVEMIVTAIADGFAVLSGQMGEVGSSAQTTGESVKESGEKADESSKGFHELEAKLNLVSRAYTTVMGAITGTMNEVAQLSDTVDNLSRSWGVSAEEASRVYQMADDLRISQGDLEMGMRKLLDNGIQPSIASMKDLSTQYLAIEDPVQRAQFAMEMFGQRGGLTFQKLLELGPEVIDTMSAANDALIMDDEAITKMNEYQAALDASEDSMLALKIAFATGPTGEGLTSVTTGFAALLTAIGKMSEATSAWEAAKNAGTVSNEQYAEAMRKFADEGYGAGEAMADLTAITQQYTYAEEDRYDASYASQQITEEAAQSVDTYSAYLSDFINVASGAADRQFHFNSALEAVKAAAEDAVDPLNDFLDSAGRQVSSPIASFIADLRFFMAGGGEIAAEFERVKAALSSGMITPGQAATILGDLYTETQSVMVDAGLQTQTEAAENISESLNVPLDAAYAKLTEIGSEFDAIAAIDATATLNVMTNILGGENEFEFLRQLANTRSFTIAINIESEISGGTSGDNGWGDESEGSGENFT